MVRGICDVYIKDGVRASGMMPVLGLNDTMQISLLW